MSEPPKPQQTDVDALARDKVDEIEKSLDASGEHKLDDLNSWLSILKQIITAADLHRTNDKSSKQDREIDPKAETGDSIYADYADDNEQFNAVDLTEQFATNSVKWTIRVRAFKIVHRIVQLYLNVLATSNKSLANRTPIIKQLPDLVRLSFVAATSPFDDLKVQGFEMFKFIIEKFAAVEDKELPGHSILEQYKSQVLSALKPTFNPDAPPYITAIASQVCSSWICYYIEKDPISLKRTYQFMLLSIEKLKNQSVNQNSKLYTESELEQERLYILGSWARLYIQASDSAATDTLNNNNPSKKELAELVKPQIDSIIDSWWEALKDFALLTMPAPKFIGVSHDSQHVYTRDVALRLFEPIWSELVLAVTIWICSYKSFSEDNSQPKGPEHSVNNNYQNNKQQNCDTSNKSPIRSSQRKYFKFVSGLLLRELCKCRQSVKQSKSTINESTSNVFRSIHLLLNDDNTRTYLLESLEVTGEFYSTLSILYNDRLKNRDPISKTIKSLQDMLFEIIVVKISSDLDQVSYGLNHLCNQISTQLQAIEEADVLKSQSEDALIKLSTYLSSLMRLFKVNCDQIISNAELLDPSVQTFRRIMAFERDPSIGVSFLNHLLSLYQSIGQDNVKTLATRLFDTHLEIVNQLVLKGKEGDKENLARQVSYLDSHLKFIRKTLDSCEPTGRQSLLKQLLECMTKVITTESRDLSNLFARHLDGCKKELPDDFKVSLTGQQRQDLDKFRESQMEHKPVAQAKKPASAQLGPSKLPTKITLKADFSNFYGKK